MLPQEQIENIKSQLISQLENSESENKEQVKKSIQMMNSEQLEQFLIQNNLIKNQQADNSVPSHSQQCIFCSIVFGDIPSNKIDENKDAIVALEINPISKGHVLIIPKKHVQKVTKSIIKFSNKISKKLKAKLKPMNIITSSSNLFGHEILNLIPVYKNETINSKRYKASQEQLNELSNLLIRNGKIMAPKKSTLTY